MSAQLQITGDTKVKNLNGALTANSGLVTSTSFDTPNGIPLLDTNGKIQVTQLPNSIMEYKGTWNVATNTPTLVNGTGNQGDVYLVTGAAVGGTAFNFGAGPITFYNGDQVIYSGTIWQRASGATGSVTSVAVTESGDALTITGSPITTSGTINIGFAGTSGQYINGAGGLTTFPSLTGFVPYTGATSNVDLGTHTLSAYDLVINHTSGSGVAASITKGGNGEALTVIKSSGSGNAASITGGVTLLDELHLTTDLADAYIASAATWNAKQNAITLTTTGTSGAATLIGATLNIPNYTPDLSGYVPYTGATSNVTLGTRDLYARAVYATNSAGTAFSSLAYDGSFNSGVLSLYVGSVENYLRPNNGISTSRAWTLPNADGTIALTSDIPSLSGYVPYTGATTTVNLNNQTLNNAALISSNGIVNAETALKVKNTTSGTFTTSPGYTLIHSSSNYFSFHNSSTQYAIFNYNGGNIYTLPSATGTLALTSDLSGYLPLSGGTLSGQLSILRGSGTGLDVASDLVIFRAATGFGSPRQITLAAGNGPTTYLEAKGYGGNYITDFGIRTYNSAGTAFEVFFATSAGNVGIGTTAPLSKFEVNDANGIPIRFGDISSAISGQTAGYIGMSTSAFSGNNGDLVLYPRTSATSKILLMGGNVGIGTTSPQSLFEVRGNTPFIRLTDTTTNAETGLIFDAGVGAIRGGLTINYSNGEFKHYCGVAGNSYFQTFHTNGSERMRITSGGNLLVGTTSDSAKLFVEGGGDSPLRLRNSGATSGRFWKVGPDSGSNFVIYNENNTGAYINNTSTSWTGNSDIRLKNVIRNIDNATDSLMTLNPVIFSWKFDNTNKENIGLIAQDVEKVYPQLIDTNGEGMLGVRYTELIPVLVAAIQEQNQLINQIREELNQLKNK